MFVNHRLDDFDNRPYPVAGLTLEMSGGCDSAALDGQESAGSVSSFNRDLKKSHLDLRLRPFCLPRGNVLGYAD